MIWKVCFILGLGIFLTTILIACLSLKRKYKRGRVLTPLKILFIGIALATIVLFVPVYAYEVSGNRGVGEWVEIIMRSIHSISGLFSGGADFSLIRQNSEGVAWWVRNGYTIVFAFLFVFAPILSLSAVLSLFNDVAAYLRFLVHSNQKVYVFSELNEKSLALAKSLYEEAQKNVLIFAQVSEKGEDSDKGFIEEAKELGALCFQKSVTAINLSFRDKHRQTVYFMIAQEQSKNVHDALTIIESRKDDPNTHLYVFSTHIETELLLSQAYDSISENGMKLRRVSEVRSLINRTLYDDGYKNIFQSAVQDSNGVKQIQALVIGMGKFGTEMVKALSWFCQMDG